VLISVGAALYALLSVEMAPRPPADPTRIAAQIVSGVGFIGAGVILRGPGGVAGITTAATIFVVAAVGIAAGAGLWKIAALTAALVVAALLALSPLERWIRPILPHRPLPDAEDRPDDHP
jgi:putative Mg2+ transporter-C (MgtC) family protein